MKFDSHSDSQYTDEPAVAADLPQTESSGDERQTEIWPEVDVTYGYAEYIDSQETASTLDDAPSEELVEAQPTTDLWDKAHFGYDYDYSSQYGNPCDPENHACHQDDLSQMGGEQIVEAATDDRDDYEQPFDAYDYDADFADSYQPSCHQEFESEGMVQELIEQSPWDVSANDQSNSVVASQEVDQGEAQAYDAYDAYSYDYDRGCYEGYDDCEEEAAEEQPSDESNPVVASQEVDQWEAYADHAHDYSYEYDRGCYEGYESCEEEAAEEQPSARSELGGCEPGGSPMRNACV